MKDIGSNESQIIAPKSPRKEFVGLRLAPSKLKKIDTIASKMEIRRSDVLRMMINDGITRYDSSLFLTSLNPI